MALPRLLAEHRHSLRANAARFSEFVERSARWWVGLWVAATFTIGILNALYTPLWLDEIMEAFIAKLPHCSEILAVAKSGADGQPPAYGLAMWASIRLFRNVELGLRIPSLIGYEVFSICLYLLVARRTSRPYGLLATLFPALTGAWYYATEGRPYGVLLGCTGVALLCWQSIAMNRRRKLALAGLSLSLACACAVHYYAPLLIAPFAFGELVRTVRRRELNFLTWMAIAAPLFVVISYLPFAGALRANSGIAPPWAWPRGYYSLQWIAAQFLEPSLVTLVCVACTYIAYQAISSLRSREVLSKPVSPGIFANSFRTSVCSWACAACRS